mgnify:CR=1 FL=1
MASALEEYFTRILWLNLDRRPDRRRDTDDELDRLHIRKHERVAAIDNPKNGNAGCTSSHRLLWRQSLLWRPRRPGCRSDPGRPSSRASVPRGPRGYRRSRCRARARGPSAPAWWRYRRSTPQRPVRDTKLPVP